MQPPPDPTGVPAKPYVLAPRKIGIHPGYAADGTHGFTGAINSQFYSDGNGVAVAVPLGASGTILTSTGATSAPTMQTPTAGMVGTVAVRTSTASKVNNTLANDDTLLFAVAANEKWTGYVACQVMNAGSNTPDFQWGWSNPVAGTVYSGEIGMAVAETTSAGALVNVAGHLANNTGSVAAISGVPTLVMIYFTYIGGANAGTVNFQFAQSSTDAGNATQLRTGSSLVAFRV